MSGALAVKQQLRSRGIRIDPTCPVCGYAPESICLMMFPCPKEKEVWAQSQVTLPPGGFSQNSVFLNLHYLIANSGKRDLDPKWRLSFPWILWHVWKARNLLCFEKISLSADEILSKATEEAMIWLSLSSTELEKVQELNVGTGNVECWKKTPQGFVKCNIGVSWSPNSKLGGAAWLLRDHNGKALLHSRHAFSGTMSEQQASLMAFSWAVAALTGSGGSSSFWPSLFKEIFRPII
ncbi:uncharacterized protein LOC106373715 [Brassica napus]|uniref:uncharacterized protein LOC106373715 n=1 Tax=Brassica napus TaxID=3708 RepID=UPI0006AA612B|nr:uncharacterized protein LOC106373715 [Brassica napus]